MVNVYIVRGEQHGAPESIIYGVYPTATLANARIAVIEGDKEEYGMDYVWFDIVAVGPNGGDCIRYNR